jgi:hypothetical protein
MSRSLCVDSCSLGRPQEVANGKYDDAQDFAQALDPKYCVSIDKRSCYVYHVHSVCFDVVITMSPCQQSATNYEHTHLARYFLLQNADDEGKDIRIKVSTLAYK